MKVLVNTLEHGHVVSVALKYVTEECLVGGGGVEGEDLNLGREKWRGWSGIWGIGIGLRERRCGIGGEGGFLSFWDHNLQFTQVDLVKF